PGRLTPASLLPARTVEEGRTGSGFMITEAEAGSGPRPSPRTLPDQTWPVLSPLRGSNYSGNSLCDGKPCCSRPTSPSYFIVDLYSSRPIFRTPSSVATAARVADDPLAGRGAAPLVRWPSLRRAFYASPRPALASGQIFPPLDSAFRMFTHLCLTSQTCLPCTARPLPRRSHRVLQLAWFRTRRGSRQPRAP